LVVYIQITKKVGAETVIVLQLAPGELAGHFDSGTFCLHESEWPKSLFLDEVRELLRGHQDATISKIFELLDRSK
jgi:hypothetical protein